MYNILLLYNANQTYTNTVYEHAASFGLYSCNRYFYLHHDSSSFINLDQNLFDAIALHYSVRLPYDQISESACKLFDAFAGLKILYIQDEYDNTRRAWFWIKKLKINIVFTVVPEGNVERVYPKEEFPNVKFFSVLTGYVPHDLSGLACEIPTSKRSVVLSYRGRPLPLRYGALGLEKVRIGQLTKNYCAKKNIPCNIEWTEADRIYGEAWYDFIKSSRAMLGSESGCNIFDWNGDLQEKIDKFKEQNPTLADGDVYNSILACLEEPGLMNQVSPRIFETIAARTVLVLFDGFYSNVLTPGVHYLSLRKDGSNIAEIISALHDAELVDSMVERAYKDIVESGDYGYPKFVEKTDLIISDFLLCNGAISKSQDSLLFSFNKPSLLTSMPVRSISMITPPALSFSMFLSFALQNVVDRLMPLWIVLPSRVRSRLTPVLKKLLKVR